MIVAPAGRPGWETLEAVFRCRRAGDGVSFRRRFTPFRLVKMPCPRAPRRFTYLLTVVVALSLGGAPTTAQVRPPPANTATWLGAGVLLGGSLLLDERFRSAVPAGGGTAWKPLTDEVNHLGNPRYLVPALAAGWAGGKLTGSPRLSTSSAHVLAALAAAGVANGATKYGVGRQRPVGGDALSFRPFNPKNRWQSFPSGHAVVAFSVAAALSEEADRGWVTALSYGTASVVGWSRVYTDKHWTSDVVGGALIGVASSHATLHFLHRRFAHESASPPEIVLAPGGVEVRFRTW